VRILFLLCVLFGIFIGCGSSQSWNVDVSKKNYLGCTIFWKDTNFPIRVLPGPDFDEAETDLVEVSLQQWNISTGSYVFSITDKFDHKQATIVLSHHDLPKNLMGYAVAVPENNLQGRLGSLQYGLILLDMPAIKDSYRYVKTLVHELGHILGFSHDEDDLSIMYKNIHPRKQEILEHHIRTIHLMQGGVFKKPSMFGDVPACFSL